MQIFNTYFINSFIAITLEFGRKVGGYMAQPAIPFLRAKPFIMDFRPQKHENHFRAASGLTQSPIIFKACWNNSLETPYTFKALTYAIALPERLPL